MKGQIYQEAETIIRKQQGKRGPVWMCGEQLLEMIGKDEAAAQLVLNDLTHGGMSLEGCEAKIERFAKANGGCCTGAEAETIIREYFGLPERAEPEQAEKATPASGDVVRLEDFF